MKSINPTNSELLATFDEYSDAYVESALERANSRFSSWKKRDYSFRKTHFLELAQLLRDRKEELSRLMALEMGKVLAEGSAEVEKCALVCEYYANNAKAFLEDKTLNPEKGNAFVSYEPLGIVLGVMPWNFPFWQVFRFVAPTVMAGNTVVLKHASNVPQCALAIEELFADAGFLPGVYQTLLISSSKVERIVADARVKTVSVTGSEYAGSQVAQAAGKNIKPSLLELGGSDAFVVLDDADIDKTARVAAKARMFNCGQSCIAAKRFIVHHKVYDQFLERFKSFMSAYTIGDPLNDTTKCGPMASTQLMEDLHEQVKDATQNGARLELGGDVADLGGAFYQPTIITGITKEMRAYHEELFGPVALVFKVNDEEEAIALANDSQFGLGGSVWTNDKERGLAVARAMETGAVFINEMTASQPALPFGGVKSSGYGRELSEEGIKAFTNQKTIYID